MDLLRPFAALCVLLGFVVAAAAMAATEVESETAEARSSYIVHVAAEHAPRLPRRGLMATRAYGAFLRDLLPVELSSPAPRVLYSYAHAATGFAAQLTGRQAAQLASSGSVLAVVPDVMQQLHTTLTPSFLGLSPSSGLLKASNGATDVIIGVIDTGVYPEGRKSFAADPSLPPPPSKFRGGGGSRRPTADAGFFDYAGGKAVGMAPGARIAVYKACWDEGCAGSDILAAFDEAITDRVDVISVSLGDTGLADNFYSDTTAVGAFRAVSKGIVVSASAGNSGPGDSTAVNIAPWILTVGASTLNRRFPGDVVLGNGETFTGTTLYAGEPLGATKLPVVYGGDVGSKVCEEGKLKPAKLAGGAGAILTGAKEDGEQVITSPHVHPATDVPFAAAEKIKKYIRTQTSPTATIVFRGTVVGPTPPSPRMASFSSRGPNFRAPEILKPDVTAPGVDILAAWTGANSPSELDFDTRRVNGIVALLRQARPEWSPAAIKSALMTTAQNVDSAGGLIGAMSTGEASTPFARGAGHIDPNSAVDPGLVYDAGTEDYITFLCALGYTAKQVAVFGSSTSCSTRAGSSVGDHNYPAFSVVITSNKKKAAVTQRRVVRNVGGDATTTYRAKITAPDGVLVTVSPETLRFSATQKTQGYAVTFAREIGGSVTGKYTFGSIEWSDGEHTVSFPGCPGHSRLLSDGVGRFQCKGTQQLP
ncbi:Subtilisin-like protease [Triticum urartu]|uniref:Subtilisin-like protease n=1 Tax=Triticum urartu TaxID=4572 RepID=M8A5Q2_TRIUA|nr:Subtilisin-like protease [Triticum urartu]